MLICGLDEVGRGALAGPLMAGAALFRLDEVVTIQTSPIPGLMDSKAFKKRESREKVWKMLLCSPFLIDFGIGEVSVEEINTRGIDWANNIAFERAVGSLRARPNYLYVDGKKPVKNWPRSYQLVEPKADVRFWPVSAASIIAKVIRDNLMVELSRDYPSYNWEENAGYGSPFHREALTKSGPCPHHRTKFISKIVHL